MFDLFEGLSLKTGAKYKQRLPPAAL